MGVSVIHIMHDLATAYYISDRLIIMQRGLLVEMGPARTVLDAPQHPYSRLLKAWVLDAADAGQGQLTPARELTELSGVALNGDRGRLVPQSDGRMVRTAALTISA